VVASLEEDSPFKVMLSLSSCTKNLPDAASRNPRTCTAVPSDSGADIRSDRDTRLSRRTGKIEV